MQVNLYSAKTGREINTWDNFLDTGFLYKKDASKEYKSIHDIDLKLVVDNFEILIPANSDYNGSSHPKWLNWLLGSGYNKRWDPVSYIHDYLYKGVMPRKLADKVWYELQKKHLDQVDRKFPRLLLKVMYRALRLFGWMNYAK